MPEMNQPHTWPASFPEAWGLGPLRHVDAVCLPGSPERCVWRGAVRDDTGTTWMLERLAPGQDASREAIARLLDRLVDKGLENLAPYRVTEQGEHVAHANGDWMLSPYVQGDPLPQPDYVDDAVRGASTGKFLAGLGRAASMLPSEDTDTLSSLNLPAYIDNLQATLKHREPSLHAALNPIRATLEGFRNRWNDSPTALAHGDLHPGNVLWRGREAAVVIDWEFTGIRPVGFDLANCLGCVGIEDPHALNPGADGFAAGLLDAVREGGGQLATGPALAELVLALRHGWLSEWLRRKDGEMVELEIRYMRLLAEAGADLARAWGQRLHG